MEDIEWALIRISEFRQANSDRLNLGYSAFLEGNRHGSDKYSRSIASQLTSFPLEVLDLQHLRALVLSNNSISRIPERIDQLIHLESLILNQNALKDLPDSIGNLRNLRHLDLSQNRLTKLPKAIVHLQDSTELILDGNPLVTPPIEIANKGLAAIKEYFSQLEYQGQDFLFEAKLLIVGEGGAGKTTLAKKIENPTYQLKEENTTKGIDVVHWQFPMPDGNVFKVNIWDFGGQEIYHATHQFFLTKRSLYALVADARNEDTDFFYWLNVVELLSDNSPILIVKNEKQDRHRQINEPQLRGRFENLKDVLATNLATNRGLENVIGEIKHHITQLPHIGSPLPKNWVRVREALERDPRNYIGLSEYLDICQNNGFINLKDKLQLSAYLHDLGVFLHFQDDPLLNKTVILKPHWATDAVYKVLDDAAVIHNQGHFRKDILSTIWKDYEYANMRDELLQLMVKFKLCYLIPGTRDIYVAPQLLQINQPQYNWDETSNLLLRYVYEFMPKGIITKFIVVMHLLIPKQSLVWKNGVILAKDKTLAEVVEYYDKREIRIRVTGKYKRELLAIIRYELSKIHATYQRLKFDELIPCNCSICKDSQEPYFYRFNIIQRFVGDRQEHIQCQKSYQMVSLQRLIDDMPESMQGSANPSKEDGRSGTFPKVEIRIGNGATVSNIVVDSSTQNSFNRIVYSDIAPELRNLLQQLVQAVNSMGKLLSEGQAEEAARDLEMLVKESTSKSPQQKWYQLSAEGLRKAAENVGAIGKPVIELVGKIIALLVTTKGQ